ncbi:hypothetical protein MNBD_IGNAVI01-1668 [hydrothermal vent metagenome]|uniref:Uncharacterized protein n=1 Tax=hydrothermal vent metagenome TaxID=652676 RepID=A0A3B1CGA5_9ZZZZ
MRSVSPKIIISIILISFVLGCSYSFTGSSVPPHLKTIAIPIVKDKSGSGEPSLSNDFTQKLTQEFTDDNSLYVVNSSTADAILSVTILSLPDRAEVVSGVNEKATKRRITMNVKAVYKDLVMKKTIFDKNFSNYGIFETDNYAENRQAAIQVAIDNLALDLLLAVVSDW